MVPAGERYRDLRKACAVRGLRLTPQRDVLLQLLGRATGHPTADEMVHRVRCVLPSVSHATVYRNLQELVSAGIISTLNRAGSAVQFEVNREDHHHFVCNACGRVWDVYLQNADLKNLKINRRRSGLSGFRVDRREVQLQGLCADCR